MRKLLNIVSRAYLRHSPLTPGKKQLFKFAKRHALPSISPVVYKTKHGFRLRANLSDVGHQRMYFYGDHDERYEINAIKRLVKGGDTCWDIGANIGFYTCLLARLVGNAGRVVAFEPVNTTSNYLEENIRLNGLANVVVVRKAMGKSTATAPIYYRHADAAEGTASLKANNGDALLFELVNVDTMDNLTQSLPSPDFIKIDVEGNQMEVLAGGEQFFKRHSPLIMAELRDTDRAVVEATQHFFEKRNYSIFEFEKRFLRRCVHIARSRSRNFLLVNESSRYRERLTFLLK